jgi:HEAT repeats
LGSDFALIHPGRHAIAARPEYSVGRGRQDGEGVTVARLNVRTWLGVTASCALGLSGCAGTYDMITSERFKERPFHTLFVTEDPMMVLEKVQEGDDRVRAMRALKEPKENGGTAEQQDRIIAILKVSAIEDKRPLCRLAAVEALTRFKDPRVGPILVAAYHNAAYEGQPVNAPSDVAPAGAFSGVKAALSTFTPETITNIQVLAVGSLGQHKNPESARLLVELAAKPAEPKKKSPGGVETASLTLEASVGTNETDQRDVRLAAIRSLGNYKGDAAAVQALIAILKTDKDVAVRGRAHESLEKITGQELPPDGSAWQAWLDKNGKRG